MSAELGSKTAALIPCHIYQLPAIEQQSGAWMHRSDTQTQKPEK
jgi:hypothetical protein